ncbi:MAG: universal stress protein, partial [Thermodesulfovibrionales bacterium]
QWEIKGALKILYATDGSDYSKKTGNILTSIPFPEDTEVTILNVNPATHISIPDRFLVEVGDRVKESVARIREAEATRSDLIIKEAREILGKRFKKADVSLRFGDPSIEILNEASSLRADIIAMGSSGLRGIKGMLGSVSRYVLGHSECSVLIGKI